MQAVPYIVAPDRHVAQGFVLRSYQLGDGPSLSEAVNSSYDHLKRFMPWAVPQQAIERSEQLCREFRGRWLLASDFVIGIWAPDESRLLGGCGYHLREGTVDVGNAEIGIWIRADAAGRGLGTSVLHAMLRWVRGMAVGKAVLALQQRERSQPTGGREGRIAARGSAAIARLRPRRFAAGHRLLRDAARRVAPERRPANWQCARVTAARGSPSAIRAQQVGASS
jgi:GNAT superfamily N-acetyltransferase